MKTFRKIIIWVVIVIAIIIIISFLLPKTYKVERVVYIKAGQSLIYDLTSHFKKWDLWVPWTKAVDSTANFELFGVDGQVGAEWKWTGKILGNGEMKVTEVKPDELIAYDLSFNQGEYQSKGRLVLEVGDSTRVSWIDEGDLGYNPISRFMGLFMDKMMGPDFEKGLAKLKKVAEERNSWPKIEEKQIPGQVVLVIRDSAGPATYGQIMGKAFGEVMQFVKSNKLVCTSPPFAIYLKWDSVTMNSVMDIGMAVEKEVKKGKGRVRVEKIPAMKVIMAHYFGPYDKTAPVYYALDKYIKESGMEEAGGPWEIYITDPMQEKDPMRVQTDILFPVK